MGGAVPSCCRRPAGCGSRAPVTADPAPLVETRSKQPMIILPRDVSLCHTAMSVLPLTTTTRSDLAPDDARLVQCAQLGEPWAADALVRRYGRKVKALSIRLVGRPDLASDVMQDVFVSVLRDLRQLRSGVTFEAWLSMIVVRTAHRALRRERLRQRLGLGVAEPVDLTQFVSAAVPPDVAAELARVYAALTKLPPKIQLAYVLRKVEQQDFATIGEMLGVSFQTVRRWVARADEHLRHTLGIGEVG